MVCSKEANSGESRRRSGNSLSSSQRSLVLSQGNQNGDRLAGVDQHRDAELAAHFRQTGSSRGSSVGTRLPLASFRNMPRFL